MIIIRGQSHHYRSLNVKKIEIISKNAVQFVCILSTLGFSKGQESSEKMLTFQTKDVHQPYVRQTPSTRNRFVQL